MCYHVSAGVYILGPDVNKIHFVFKELVLGVASPRHRSVPSSRTSGTLWHREVSCLRPSSRVCCVKILNIWSSVPIVISIFISRFMFPPKSLAWGRVPVGVMDFKLFVPCICSAYEIKNQQMSLFQFYSYIDGSLHVSGQQTHLQESSHSCSHNHWFSVCTVQVAREQSGTDTEPMVVCTAV